MTSWKQPRRLRLAQEQRCTFSLWISCRSPCIVSFVRSRVFITMERPKSSNGREVRRPISPILDQKQLHPDWISGSLRMGRRRSQSASSFLLPSIPEYPGFQDVKVTRSLPATAESSPASLRKEPPLPKTVSLMKPEPHTVLSLVRSSLLIQGAGGAGRRPTIQQSLPQDHRRVLDSSPGPSLEEYFQERLKGLKNYEARKLKADSTQQIFGHPNESRCCNRLRNPKDTDNSQPMETSI